MYVEVVERYGPFKKKAQKNVVATKRDHYVLTARGKNYCVPKCFCEEVPYVRNTSNR